MPRITGNHETFFEYIYEHLFIRPKKRLGHMQHFDLDIPTTTMQVFGYQLLGGFQPWADMYKDLVDTFKPYKSTHQLWNRDIYQPWEGAKNIAKGVITLIGAPLLWVINAVRYIPTGRDWFFNMANSTVNTASWLIEGASNIVRGATQLVTTPLTWCGKIPLRLYLTNKHGTPKIEQSKNIQKYAKIGETLIDTFAPDNDNARTLTPCINLMIDELHRKYEKALSRGQLSNIKPADELDRYDAILHASRKFSDDQAAKAKSYMRLFKEAVAPQEPIVVNTAHKARQPLLS